mmetsp:Transcript_3862/g.8529  ORF Transcript_3862/g.8529 Transcript_3862/m.8529 type:complete len:126 (-) Transcript_3862:73-450(-)|eukprot:CAMPEP_0172175388 /NCGR_PEP_ID=MMETSP1050-20130122/14197_1 /TAXON_ID=233186 /ORGANISM="Cryptomonas curvata, Strain CCAP979/52" /LENGTH=125 /DNA_ID=CAMNT_0012847479 /DNA_START=143 /DNA_END=520 /DNA_ORIENTATION=+
MSSVKALISAAAASIGPNAKVSSRQSKQDTARINVASASEDTVVISQMDAVLFETFGKDSPVIPAGVVITAIILTSGLFSLKNNNKAQQQVFMRLRVGAQGITVLAMLASLVVQERQKSLGIYRR